MKNKKKSTKTETEERLLKENAKLRKALQTLISTWRDNDHAYGEICFEACQKAKAVLESSNNKLTER